MSKKLTKKQKANNKFIREAIAFYVTLKIFYALCKGFTAIGKNKKKSKRCKIKK
jgi:hypothetical protein